MHHSKTAAVLALLVASSTYAKGLAGTYDAAGTSANGKGYTAVVTIEAKGDNYVITWKLAAESYTGVGILQDGVLSAAWTTAGRPGVCVYRVKGDTLEGHWSVVDGNGQLYPETLTRR